MLLSINEHADKFSKVLSQLSNQNSQWLLASKWVELAASINSVNVVTASFDDTLYYCETALHYENERSNTLQKFVYEISMFNFIWNGLEVITKIINPPKIPNNLKKRRNIIDDAIFFLKNNFPYIPELPKYTCLFKELEKIIQKDSIYQDVNFKELYNKKICDNSGKALSLIRLIRNDFAHGSSSLPIPQDWNLGSSISEKEAIKKIRLSSHLLLLTQQMLLISFYKDESFFVHIDMAHSDETADIINILYSLHIVFDHNNLGLFYYQNQDNDTSVK